MNNNNNLSQHEPRGSHSSLRHKDSIEKQPDNEPRNDVRESSENPYQMQSRGFEAQHQQQHQSQHYKYDEDNQMPLRERNSDSTQQRKRKVAGKQRSTESKIRKEMSQLFLDQIYLEKEVEKLKMDLAHRIDFTCMSAF